MRTGLSLLVALVLGGCTPKSKDPKPLWTYDPQTYFDDSSFAASHFSRSAVLITKHNGWETSREQLTALDPATGAVRWQRERGPWVLHPSGAVSPLVLIGEPVMNPGTEPDTFSFLTEVDAATGRDVKRVTFEKSILRFEAFFASAGDRVLYLGSPALREPRVLGLLDPATGKSLWQVPSPAGADRFVRPLVLRDRVLFGGMGLVAHSLADGHELFRSSTNGTLVASPDGAHVYVNAHTIDGPGAASEVQADGKVVARYAGPVVAASDRFVAVGEGTPASELRVYRHGESTPVWSDSIGDPSVLTSVSFAGDRVVFFRSTDRKVWMHDLTSNKERALAQLHGDFVISPDAVGATRASLGSPVVVDGATAFMLGDRIQAYRIE